MLPEKTPLFKLEVVKRNPYNPTIPFKEGEAIPVYKVYIDKRYREFGGIMVTHNGIGYISIPAKQTIEITKRLGE